MKIKVKKLKAEAVLPQMMRPGDAAMDLYAVEEMDMPKGKVVAISTGVALEIPDGYVGNVRDRGGLARNHGFHTLGGIFDSNYRGDITVVAINLGAEDYKVKIGDRIAQIMIHRIESIELEEVEELSETERGEKRFASSGY
jgi:dUTP pyrophosphatase